ncbi:MAG: diacylglycerol kinase family lipid kinase [candidate division KSB1 bacterium]|nr:diacylglycerol kinase family lipid kinase [candidate division KSB1 bacterium]
MKLLLIYNPQAGHRRARKILPEVETTFVRHGIEFDLALTDYPEHAIERVREADFSQYDGIVAAGGDGTLYEVINGYFQNPSPRRIPIGVLPIGTGNAFARDLDLDLSRWSEAVAIIAAHKPRKVDVGRFRCHGQTYYFLNIIGLGFVADVTETAAKLKRLGNIAYTIGVFHRMIRLKTSRLYIQLDGQTLDRECIFVEISNTRYTSNFFIAPDARIDDGLLDVVVLNRMSRVQLLRSFPKVFTGEHVHLPQVETYQVRQIRIEAEEPKVLAPDGELAGITPVDIECLPGAVEVFWK